MVTESAILECFDGYHGFDCSQYFCFNVSFNDPETCSGNGNCVDIDNCVCNQNTKHGFWTGRSCNSCVDGFYGDECSTHFENPIFSDEGDAIHLTLFGPDSYISNLVDCNRLLETTVMDTMYGEEVKCLWLDKHFGKFSIFFGTNPNLFPNTEIKLNTRVFDSNDIITQGFQKLTVLESRNPFAPVSIIDETKKQFGSCDELLLDGSKSYSFDRRKLIYSWKFLSGSLAGSVDKFLISKSLITIPSEYLNPGIFIVELTVTSTLTYLSHSMTFTFEKVDFAIPKVEIIGSSIITTPLSSLPIFIKKYVFPSCLPLDTVLTFVWNQTSGTSLKFEQDKNNDLVIEDIIEKRFQSFSIDLTVFFRYIMVDLYILQQSNELLSLDSDISDPDNSNDQVVYIWECIDCDDSFDPIKRLHF